MKRPSLFPLVRRGWMVLVAVAVVAVAAFCVYRLHGIFGSGDTTSTSSDAAEDIVPFNPKDVVYEVFGAPGATATINYLDVNAAPQQVVDAPLPWRYQATTTEPAVIADLRAQGDGDTLGCRIVIDGELKDERTSDAVSAYIFCLDKSG
ncbi:MULTISPECIES: MmpS family transport accessory protein [Mycolicibacter]|uniref:MmpS family transport accessory protein n=1 Tax=Mycolicibacter TaxID=1073531 RepID=UPI000AAAD087|nr:MULTISPECIES: MmpS family transport accessory protein [Mycolicibacter]ULP48476.1 MmpS family protein [Mycolicibacter virginiensis]